jgi:hypothetical protein
LLARAAQNSCQRAFGGLPSRDREGAVLQRAFFGYSAKSISVIL